MKNTHLYSFTLKSAVVCLTLLVALTTKAAILYWDPTGTTLTLTPSANWEDNAWASTATPTATPGAFVEGSAVAFSVTNIGAGIFTVTVSNDHTFAGIFNGAATGTTGATNVFITGPGILSIASGIQGFGTLNSFQNTTINATLAGTGGIQNQNSGSLFLYGTNSYSGGTSLGTSAGLNFNNNNSFGTGLITNAVSLTVLATPAADNVGHTGATGPINITNSVATYGGGNSQFIMTGIAAAPVTMSGPWTLVGAAGTTASLDIRTITGSTATWTISGPISGAQNVTKLNTANLVLSGANTYSGKTVVANGILNVTSLNKLSGGSASSSLGHPTTTANGTIGLGATTTAGTLIYTGAGETTDRNIDLAGTTGGATIQSDGTGALVFSNFFTSTGAGAKTLTLQGTNTGNNLIAAVITNSSSGAAVSVTKSGAGTWTLAGSNTYSGATTLNTAGQLNLANPNAMGGGVFTIGGNGFFDNTSGADLTVTNAFTLSGGSPTYLGTANNMTINGAVTLSGANRTITVSNTATLTLGGAVGQDASNRGLTKNGSGMLRLLGVNTYAGNTTVSAGNLTIGGSGKLGGSGGSYSGTISDSGTFNFSSSAAQTLLGAISGAGTVVQNGSGTLTLSGTNTYTGATTINASTLALTANGSLANGSSVSIAAGATLDVSGRTLTTYTLGTSATLSASGTGITVGSTAASIVGAASGVVSLGSRPITLNYTPTAFTGDATHPSLYISQGTLSLNGNAFTVTNASGTALDVGTYVIIAQASDTITSAGLYSVTVLGSGVTAGNTAYISVSGGNVNLIVAPTVSFSGLTASQSISYGTTSVTLSGTVSGAGPIYPAMGETVTAIINGNSQSTTINDATGDFSFSYNPSSFPASGTAYAIKYVYPGNGTVTSAATDSSTALTVNKAALSITASNQTKTYGQSVTFSSGSTSFSSSGLQNGETVGSVTLACTGGGVNAPVSGSPYTITPSAATGGTFSTNNYTLTYNNGILTVNPATLTVTATGTLIYGSDPSNAVYSAQYATLQGTDTLALISGSADFSTDATATNYVGSNYVAHIVDIGTLVASNYVFAAGPDGVLTITNRQLTVTNVLADKVYDGITNAPLNFTNAGLDGLVNGDAVSLVTSNATGSFGDRNAGAGKAVSISGVLIDSDLGTNYFLVQPSITATISPLPVTVTAVADTKIYDGTTNSGGVPLPSPALAPGDTGNFIQSFDNRNAGMGKTLTPTGSVNDGNSGANYMLTFASTSNGEIDSKSITVTAVSDSKGYDGNTTSAGVPMVSPALISPDTAGFTQAFATKHAGTGKTVVPSGSANDGNSGANYSVSFVNDTTGVITPAPITVTAVATTKAYDGTITSSGVPTVSPGLAPGDGAGFSQTYDTKDVGTGKTLTPAGSVTDGNAGGDYSVTFSNNTSGVITQLATATVLLSSVNPSGPGTNVTFTASVNGTPPAADLPTGDVVFSANGTPFATNTLVSGSTTATNGSLPVGTNTVTAEYLGDGNFLGSTGEVDQVVKLFITYSTTNVLQSISNNNDGTFTLSLLGTPDAQYYVVTSPDVSVPTSTWAVVPGSTNTAPSPTGLWSLVVSNAAPAYYRSAAVNPAP